MLSHLPLKYQYLKSFFYDKEKKIFLCLKCTTLPQAEVLSTKWKKTFIF